MPRTGLLQLRQKGPIACDGDGQRQQAKRIGSYQRLQSFFFTQAAYEKGEGAHTRTNAPVRDEVRLHNNSICGKSMLTELLRGEVCKSDVAIYPVDPRTERAMQCHPRANYGAA